MAEIDGKPLIEDMLEKAQKLLIKKDKKIKKQAEVIGHQNRTIAGLRKQIPNEAWKGKDKIDILLMDGGDWQIIEHRKDKVTGIVKETTKYATNENVKKLWEIISHEYEKDEPIKAKELWMDIIDEYDLVGVHRNSFNGGTNRTLYYFPYYYYPLKVLEHMTCIEYGGSGIIRRIVDEAVWEITNIG